ncbi:MAG: ATP-dependent 6-phosphofructokinase [Sandaracinaceae bacterium]|jgi:6-phosphofructokinase 1|nr:ATP-dependent 6-phosphofructokinase [Sandaracinaceae bacterium]
MSQPTVTPPRRIAVLTSGGDSPGMNACVRAIGRVAETAGAELLAVMDGYAGLLDNRIFPLERADLDARASHGGTRLGTARCAAFMQPEGRARAAEHLRAAGADALVVIGGDGSMRGALALMNEQGIAVGGVPGTIDCDVLGTDETIGFDTAVGRGVEAIDRLRDTAESHHRVFLVEVMGRHSGAIAMAVGVAGGAEAIVTPEWPTDVPVLAAHLIAEWAKRNSSVVVVAEGDDQGGAAALAAALLPLMPGADMRVTVLGHVQRGGAPSPRDRILAARLGADVASGLLAGERGFMSGMWHGDVRRVPIAEVACGNQEPATRLADLARALSLLS